MLGDSGVHRSRALSVAARAQIAALALVAACLGAAFVPMPFLRVTSPSDDPATPGSPAATQPPVAPPHSTQPAPDAPDPTFMAERFNNAALRADPADAAPDPEPDSEPVVALAPAGVQYLGCILGGASRRALLRIDGSQHLIPEGSSVEGIEIISVSASAATIRDAEGERTLTISKRSDSSWSAGGTGSVAPLAGSTPESEAEREQLERERRDLLNRARDLRREVRPRPADSRRESPE